MSGDRIARAQARIESAIRRIETSAPRAPKSGPASDPALSEKYTALRGEAGRALAEIDQLIAQLAP